jgi:hypothetical protein
MEISEDGRHDSGIQQRMDLERYAISTMNGVSCDERVTGKTKKKKIQDNNANILYGSKVWYLKNKTNTKLLTELEESQTM